jgi:acetate---CoA ligase (ADP-forming)
VTSSAVRDVILRDGQTLRLRTPSQEDGASLLAFFERLSEQSLLYRFHGFPAVGPELVAPFLESGGTERGGLVGTMADRGGERIVAIASWARLRDPQCAEVAFAVEDPFQGRGVGTRLLEQLAGVAADAGIETFVAEVMAENRGMLNVFEDAGFDVTRALDRGTVEVRFPIESTDRYRSRVDERDHVAVVASLRPFFQPASVAVVGASARPGSIGGTVFRNILAGGFAGRAYPVNRSCDPVGGVAAVRSVAQIGEQVDLAILCVPAPHVLDAVADVLSSGTRAICVISAGFAEIGREGAERQERLLALVRAHGARLIGPNCLGLAVSDSRLNATFAPTGFPEGPIGLVSQSGALGLALLEAANERGLGFSAFVSVGNKADVSSNDLLEWWEDDPSTHVVLLYLESFGNPGKFGRIARSLARRKPLVAVKSGSSRAGARAASSHTAALAGSESAVEALFHQAGVTRARSLEELLDVATLYASGAAPRGRRVALATNAGGLAILCADACEAAGLELPRLRSETRTALAALLPAEAALENPVDMLGTATAGVYEAVVPVLLADSGIDSVIALFVPVAAVEAGDVAGAVARARDGADEKPVLAVLTSENAMPPGAHPAGIAVFPYPESAARALGKAAARAEWLRRPAGVVPKLEGVEHAVAQDVIGAALRRGDDVWLSPDEARRLLEAYRMPLVPERVANSVDEAAAAAAELGYPVAVKTGVPGIHKTDVAGVKLNVVGEAALRQAAHRIGPPLVVQPMVCGGVELLAGLVQDPVFGPLIAFGPGGRLAELIGEAGFRLAPLTDADAEELVDEGKAGQLVRGFRGAPPADAHALVELLHRLSHLGTDLRDVAELDLNPVIALPDGCVSVDARVRVRRAMPSTLVKTW